MPQMRTSQLCFLITKKSLKDRFNEWMLTDHGKRVFGLFITHALALLGRDKRIGAKAIVEHLRYYHSIEHVGQEFKINNSYTSYMVREAVYRHPELAGYFTMKELKHG